MNALILSMIILTVIISPSGSIGLILGIAFCYFILANNIKKRYIIQKFKQWSWYDWRV